LVKKYRGAYENNFSFFPVFFNRVDLSGIYYAKTDKLQDIEAAG
jgi:hypothetical protein